MTQDQRANKSSSYFAEKLRNYLFATPKKLYTSKTNAHPQWLHGTEFQIPVKASLGTP